MADFELIQDENFPWWVEVWYPQEEKPRYLINMRTGKCTCKGNTHNLLCKHLKELPRMNKTIEVKCNDQISQM